MRAVFCLGLPRRHGCRCRESSPRIRPPSGPVGDLTHRGSAWRDAGHGFFAIWHGLPLGQHYRPDIGQADSSSSLTPLVGESLLAGKVVYFYFSAL